MKGNRITLFANLISWLILVPRISEAQLPSLVSSTPARNSLTGTRTGPISLTFSRPVTSPADIRITSNQVVGRRPGTFSGSGTTQVSFQPTQPFFPGERVSVTVPAAVSNPAQVVEFLAAAGRGAAVFGAPVTVATPPSVLPKIVVAGDVDQDGDLDLIVGEFATTHVCLNDGTGIFTTQSTPVSAAREPSDLRLADFNGDGYLDLLSSGSDTNGVWLSLGTGRGTFLNRTLLFYTTFTAQLAIGDFNADGYLDVMAVEPLGTLAELSFLPGSANGLSAIAYTTLLSAEARDLGAADMDGDGDLDLVAVRDATVGVYLNDGSGRFTAGAVSTINTGSAELTIGDFTGDGYADVVCSSGQGTNVSLVAGTGTGGLGTMQSISVQSRTYKVNSGDMDGDADLDLIITNDRGITQILLNSGRGQFAPAKATLIGFEPFSMAAAADLNGDGALDIYTGNEVSNPAMPHGIDVFFNTLTPITATTNGIKLAVIEAFPNPAHQQTTLVLPAGTQPVHLEIHDLMGRLVQSLSAQQPNNINQLPVNLTGLTPGMYSITIRNSNYRGIRWITII